MVSEDDRHLIERFKHGDLLAFEALVRKYQDRTYNLCRRMLHDTQDAEDAAQDVFVKAYRNLVKFSSAEASFNTWLYRITINTCLDYRKKSRLEPLKDEAFGKDLPSEEPSPEQLYQSKETGKRIDTALEKLPKKLRAAIVLKEIEGLSYEEIAQVLETSVGTVKSRISRAREALVQILQKNNE